MKVTSCKDNGGEDTTVYASLNYVLLLKRFVCNPTQLKMCLMYLNVYDVLLEHLILFIAHLAVPLWCTIFEILFLLKK